MSIPSSSGILRLETLHNGGKLIEYPLPEGLENSEIHVLLKGPVELEGFQLPPETVLSGWRIDSLSKIRKLTREKGIVIESDVPGEKLSLQGTIRVLGDVKGPFSVEIKGKNNGANIIWRDSTYPFYWDSRWLGFIPREITIHSDKNAEIIWDVEYTDALTPPLADFNAILFAKDQPRSYNLYRWSADPSILVFDFKDYREQALYLKRLAFFTEKPGYRGQLLSNEDLEGKHGWNAHDYSAQGLADFFNAAAEFPLNPEEYRLLKILSDQGILTREGSRYVPRKGAVLSISRESSSYLRQQFITHEAIHGLFFTHKEYRESVFKYWESQDEEFRTAWETYLYYNEHPYDSSWTYLAVNELAAYFLQSPKEQAEAYFLYRFQRVAAQETDAAEVLNRFVELHRDRFYQTAIDMEELLRQFFPFFGGDFSNMDILEE